MRRCGHAAYCKHAPHMCSKFLGNPMNFILGGCPLIPTREEVDLAKAKAGGLSLTEPVSGALSLVPDAD